MATSKEKLVETAERLANLVTPDPIDGVVPITHTCEDTPGVYVSLPVLMEVGYIAGRLLSHARRVARNS